MTTGIGGGVDDIYGVEKEGVYVGVADIAAPINKPYNNASHDVNNKLNTPIPKITIVFFIAFSLLNVIQYYCTLTY